ncbi:hypothetical protein KIN20_032214 [Parelaphostrongylus tenuis]|uniref:Reverse transcriptase domain-containing protein n=1 Tax=Parelaphostrongylus tenuis TaxID=148309 RepID=A0AAD5R6L9_PARTN|nr:hypothetical protein KIN20_032214 [Parelaphostrongylus tenuis]
MGAPKPKPKPGRSFLSLLDDFDFLPEHVKLHSPTQVKFLGAQLSTHALPERAFSTTASGRTIILPYEIRHAISSVKNTATSDPDRTSAEHLENLPSLSGIPPALNPTFIDYEKAFDGVETNAVLSALVDQGVDPS